MGGFFVEGKNDFSIVEADAVLGLGNVEKLVVVDLERGVKTRELFSYNKWRDKIKLYACRSRDKWNRKRVIAARV